MPQYLGWQGNLKAIYIKGLLAPDNSLKAPTLSLSLSHVPATLTVSLNLHLP